MPGGSGAEARPRRRALLGGLAVALLVGAGWTATHPARPLEPTGDLYTHLMVARHLTRGEGFVTDIAYPLAFAWPFARRLPQPLIHRAPGYALLLAGPVAAVGGDPDRSIAAARILQLGILTGLLWLGSSAWLARGRPGAAVGWALLLAAHPLAAYAIDWGHDEWPAALVLLAVWLRHRDGARSPAAGDGLLLGALALLRPELLWLPILWWLLRGPVRPPRRAVLVCSLAFVLVAGPWAVRNALLTGDPLFSLQSRAEHLKDTRTFPEYQVYRQLEPQPLLPTLLADPEPVARKTVRGLRFFRAEQGAFMPPVITVGLLLLGLELLRRRCLGWRRGPTARPAIPKLVAGPGLAGLSLGLLACLYAVFDHSVRHFEVLLPIVAWELGALLVEAPWAWVRSRLETAGRGGIPVLPSWLAVSAAALAALVLVRAAVRPPTGWDQAEAAAQHSAAQVGAEVERLRAAPAGVVFVQTAAAPWFADRPAVWSPLDDGVRRRIRELIEAGP